MGLFSLESPEKTKCKLKSKGIKILFALFIIVSGYNAQNKKNSSEQSRTLDSLLEAIKIAKEDTSKVDALNKLAYQFISFEPQKSLNYAQQALKLSEQLNWKKGIAKSEGNMGYYYYTQSYYFNAITHWQNSLSVYKELKDKSGVAIALGNIGIAYYDQSDYPKALEYYFKALKMAEELGDKSSIARQLGNIGNVYADKSDGPKALEYYFKALKMAEDLGDKRSIAIDLGNIGIVYKEQSDYPKALEYYFKALKMAEDLGDKRGIAIDLCNIGIVYKDQSNYPKALEYYLKALKTAEELGDKSSIAITLGNIGSLYIKTKQYKEAEAYLKKSIALSDSLGILSYTRNFEKKYCELDSILGDYKGSFEHYKKYIIARDSIDNEENANRQIRTEMNYEFEKKQAEERAEQDKKDTIAKEEKRRQEFITYTISGFAVLVLILAVVIFRSLSISKKKNKIISEQKQEVEKQKHIVEEKNKDIIDSIVYAKRIQQAILPNEKQWFKTLPDSFVLYQPKDIVAGDFYWMEETNDYIFIAAADCTGHGVPGAMVSVVCSNALTKAVLEEKKNQTNAILDSTRNIVLEKLSKGEENIQDGMDICLVRISKKNRKEIQYSGANRSLIIITKDKTINEIRPDKQPIGQYAEAKMFSKSEMQLEQGTMLYLLTDGCADQFGGEKGKKIGTRNFKELLAGISRKETLQQHQEIKTFYQSWKQNNEQVDDVTVIGVRI